MSIRSMNSRALSKGEENSDSGPFRLANSKSTPSTRVALQDVTNRRPVAESTPARNMNLALLNRKVAARTYQSSGNSLAVPSVTGSSVVPSVVSNVTRESIPETHSVDYYSGGVHGICSPLGCGMSLPIDDFSPVGVNPYKFNHMEAARNAIENGGTLHYSRMCSPFSSTNVINDYTCKAIDMPAIKAEQAATKQALFIEEVSKTGIDSSETEWYEDGNDGTLSILSIETIDIVDNHALDIESEYVQERLLILEKENIILQQQVVDAHEDCRRMQEEIESNDGLQAELNQDLQRELALKMAEMKEIQSDLDDKSCQVEQLEQVATSMEQINSGLSDELRSALNMLDDAHERDSAAAQIKDVEEKSNTRVTFDDLSEAEQASIRTVAASEAMEMVTMKQNVIQSLEDDLQKLTDQLQKQAEQLVQYQTRVSTLDAEMASNATKITNLLAERDELIKTSKQSSTEQAQTATQAQVALAAKCEELHAIEMRAEVLENELKYKDEELMMLLQSSVQSSDIAAKKLSKVESQLSEKTTALKSANETNASYLKRHTAFEQKEQELLQVRDENTQQIEELQYALKAALIEKESMKQVSDGLQRDADKCQAKIHELEDSLKSSVQVHMSRLTEQKVKDADYVKARKDLTNAKIKITELESNLRTLRLGGTSVSSSRSPSFHIASPFGGGVTPIANSRSMDGSDVIPAPTPPGSAVGHAASSLSSTISLLESQVFLLEGQCKESHMENLQLREQYEASKRDIVSITDELHRSRSSLEKQLKSSTESESELASKVCDLNAQLEQLMNYSMKLTSELSKSKECEKNNVAMVTSLETEMHSLRTQLSHSTNSQREEEVAYTMKAQAEEVEHWKKKLVGLEREYDKVLDTITKAKASKVRRYNKYVNLQQDYKIVVAQVERLVSENSDLRARHKVFVKTVEAALVGGEGKIALDKFKAKDALPGSEAHNRSLLEMSQELMDGHHASTLSDIEDASDSDEIGISPQRCF
jgi:chromosome segregation ATPase